MHGRSKRISTGSSERQVVGRIYIACVKSEVIFVTLSPTPYIPFCHLLYMIFIKFIVNHYFIKSLHNFGRNLVIFLYVLYETSLAFCMVLQLELKILNYGTLF